MRGLEVVLAQPVRDLLADHGALDVGRAEVDAAQGRASTISFSACEKRSELRGWGKRPEYMSNATLSVPKKFWNVCRTEPLTQP